MLFTSLIDYNLYYKQTMSAQDTQNIPILKILQQQQEAKRTSQAYKDEFLAQPDDNKSKTQTNDSEAKEQEPRIQIDASKIIQKNINIFREKTQNQNKVNIFDNKQSINLLNLSQQQSNNGLNIFDKILKSNPIINQVQSDEQASENSQSSKDCFPTQQMKQPTQKIMKYQYKNTLKILGTFKIAKFRVGTSMTKESVLLNLEEDQNNQIKMLYFTIKTEGTLLNIYNGVLLKNVKIEQFMGKQQNLKLNVMKVRRGEGEGSMKGEMQQIKIQLVSGVESVRLQELVRQFFKDQ